MKFSVQVILFRVSVDIPKYPTSTSIFMFWGLPVPVYERRGEKTLNLTKIIFS